MATQDQACPLPQGSLSPSSSPPSSSAAKRIHNLVVDTGPLIKNEPALSTLLSQADQIYTIPSVLTEIKDEATRSRVHTTLLPFLKLRNPRPDSIRFITDFSRRTGDLEVLSKPDIHLLALCYELEIETNGGDWRLRRTPAQKGLNGKPPTAAAAKNDENVAATFAATTAGGEEQKKQETQAEAEAEAEAEASPNDQDAAASTTASGEDVSATPATDIIEPQSASTKETVDTEVEAKMQSLGLQEEQQQSSSQGDPIPTETTQTVQEEEDEEDDDDGWITPSNLKKHQAKDAAVAQPSEVIQETLQAALLTSDFAMQNVALRINLNLVSPSNLSRIKQLKSWVLRCYGCFNVTRQMNKQFCPKCGQATLTRTSCSTDASGQMRLHLKKNFQYNKRGNVYSIPKPVHGSANGKSANVQGGGKNHWGKELILTEDQKEYSRKVDEDRRSRQRDLMDEDYLPNLLSGERTGGHGRIRVGAGRNVNAKKRR